LICAIVSERDIILQMPVPKCRDEDPVPNSGEGPNLNVSISFKCLDLRRRPGLDLTCTSVSAGGYREGKKSVREISKPDP
jgi:hypothetical protein